MFICLDIDGACSYNPRRLRLRLRGESGCEAVKSLSVFTCTKDPDILKGCVKS